MGRYFSEIVDNLDRLDVIMLQSPSKKLLDFLFDIVYVKTGSNRDTTIVIRDKEDFKTVQTLQGILTPQETKWLVRVDLSEFKETNNLASLISKSDTCIFFITTDYYRTYKEMKSKLKYVQLLDFYITYLNRTNILYLYDFLVPSKLQCLSTTLMSYVYKNYSSDIDLIFDLFGKLAEGTKVARPTDVAKLIGVGGNNVENLIFTLLAPISGTDKGIKMVMKKRYALVTSIYETLGPKKFYDYYSKTLVDFIMIQYLRANNVIYDNMTNLPEMYKELSRYNRYLWRFKELGISKLLRLYSLMPENFDTIAVILDYLYSYYRATQVDILENVTQDEKKQVNAT